MAKKAALADQIAEKLQQMISNEYKNGDRLPVENELARKFNVSRITIREAMIKLKALGIVEVRQGDGTFVSDLTPSSFMAPIVPMLTLNNTDIREIFEVRILLECKAVENAALHATPEELEQLRIILSKMDSLALNKEVSAYNEQDLEFHRLLAGCSHNQVICTIYNLLLDLMKKTILSACSTPEHVLNSVIFHNRIFNFIAAHNASAASAQMEEHLRDGLVFIENSILSDQGVSYAN